LKNNIFAENNLIMKTNTTLQIAGIVLQLTLWGSLLITGIFIFISIHWSISTDTYTHMQLSDNGILLSYSFTEGSTATQPERSMADLHPLSLYFNLLKSVCYLLVIAWMSKIGLKITRSVAAQNTFLVDNAKNLRQIAKGFLILMVLTAIQFVSSPEYSKFAFEIKMGYLIAGLAALVLARVFEEGHLIAEEQKHTI
jgi:hypothetical protein